MKDKILNHLLAHHKKTKWNFVSLTHLQSLFGKDIRNELNELYREGYIQKREEVNNPLIELIKFE